MSGVTRSTHVGRYLRLESCDGICINWAVEVNPDGTGAGIESSQTRYARNRQERLARLETALEPVLIEIAAASGGTLLLLDDPGFAERRQVIPLMVAGVETMTLEAALPCPLEAATQQRLHVCAAETWSEVRHRRPPKRVEALQIGVPPWEAFPHLWPRSLGWRMGEAEQFMTRWSAGYAQMDGKHRDDYQAKHPAPFYWFWFYWRPNEVRTRFSFALAFITFPWRWWNHRAHRQRASVQHPQ